MMVMLRLNVPSVFIYGGSILPGSYKGKDVTIVDVFEGVGQHAAGNMSRADLDELEAAACPCAGSCGGQFTANTMASAIEALGLSLPGAASVPAVDPRMEDISHRSGAVLQNMLERDIKPRDILTREAFENAIAVVMAFGGSTNAVLHLLAIANEADVDLTLDDFARIAADVPHLGDLKPFGQFVMNDVDRVGGVPAVMNTLLKAGLMHGDVMTVTGKTLAENMDELKPAAIDGRVVRALNNPIHKSGGITILKGSLAPRAPS